MGQATVPRETTLLELILSVTQTPRIVLTGSDFPFPRLQRKIQSSALSFA